MTSRWSLLWRIPVSVVTFVVGVLVAMNVSPIYDFEDPSPFSGDEIYNPYSAFDSATGWKRANFHTHTHATKWINECEYYPDSVLAFYERFGYDVVTFSNHMELTEFPSDPSRQVWVYEHGINLGKLHNLVFNPSRVKYFDCSVAYFKSQQQFKIDRLSRGADFVFLNHPDRTWFIDEERMSQLTGYRLVEADCGFSDKSTYGAKWDAALSAGHYVPSAISDDLHRPDLTRKIARRCSFLNISSPSYENIKTALLSGNFYTMHLPDFGSGDWNEKYLKNADLPVVTGIGLRDSLVFLSLDRPASTIETIGQGGAILQLSEDADSCSYVMKPEDSYARLVARFEDGTVLYTNPFARWSGSSPSGTPYITAPHPVRPLATAAYNLLVVGLALLLLALSRRCLAARR